MIFCLGFSKEDVKVLCCPWVSNGCRTPMKHKMRIKPWYVQVQQNWAIFLQVNVTYFEYWLLSKFSHLTALQNKSHPCREIFRIWTRGNKIFFPVKRKNYGKTILIWTAPETIRALKNSLFLHYWNEREKHENTTWKL